MKTKACLLLLLASPIVVSCAQVQHGLNIYINNLCGINLKIKVENFSNFYPETSTIEVKASQKFNVGNYVALGMDVQPLISENYSLTINAASATKKINQKELIELVNSTKRFKSAAGYEWLIEDASICPA